MKRTSLLLALGATIATVALWPRPAAACGGFFCNGNGATQTPVVQAAERVLFEQRGDGTVRAYVQIGYQQNAPVGFSWLVPVMGTPELGVADAATFDQLDAASSPQFRFINSTSALGSGTSSSSGSCGADASSRDFIPEPPSATPMDNGVQVFEESRVGDYTTSILQGEDGAAIRGWLTANGYDIPAEAEPVLDHYTFTGHRFAAFRYDPLSQTSGALPPIVITYPGTKPCVPIKITAIASVPVLDVMVMTFGRGRAVPDGEYLEIVPDYADVQQDFTTVTQTTYYDEVDEAVSAAGGHGWVVEHASSTHMLEGLTDPEAIALVERNRYVTRFYTRLSQDFMDVDPEFTFTEDYADVNRLHVIDPTQTTARVESRSSDLSYAAGAPFGLALLTLGVRRFRRRRK